MKHNITRAATMCALAAALAGCGTYTKFETLRHTDVENAYEPAADGDSTSMGDIRWEDFFPDERLRALIGQALEQNADMRSTLLGIEAAKASLKASKLAFLPSAEIGGTASHSDGAWDTQLPVSASWTVDLFGSLRNAKRGQQAALLQTEAYAQAVRSELIVTVASTYYSLLSLDAQLGIYEETERTWRENVETTRRLVKSGRYNAVSLAQAEANYYGVRNSLVDIRQQIAAAENTLRELVGETSLAVERGTLDEWRAPEAVDVGIPAVALYNRPDVRQAEQALAQTFYAENAARSAFYPSLTITGSYEFRHSLYEAVGSLLQPIFQRGTLKANLKSAQVAREQAEIAFRQALVTAGLEVNDALVAVKSAREKSENYARQIESLTDAARFTELLMRNSSTTYLELLTAQQSLLEAQINEVVNRQNEISALLTLYQALGGGAY